MWEWLLTCIRRSKHGQYSNTHTLQCVVCDRKRVPSVRILANEYCGIAATKQCEVPTCQADFQLRWETFSSVLLGFVINLHDNAWSKAHVHNNHAASGSTRVGTDICGPNLILHGSGFEIIFPIRGHGSLNGFLSTSRSACPTICHILQQLSLSSHPFDRVWLFLSWKLMDDNAYATYSIQCPRGIWLIFHINKNQSFAGTCSIHTDGTGLKVK